MSSEGQALPLPVSFALPDRWRPTTRAELPPGVAFAAVAQTHTGAITPTIAVDGWWLERDDELDALGDRSIENLRAAYGSGELVDRQIVGNVEAPALVQTLGATITVDHGTIDVVQSQVWLVVPEDEGRRALIRATLSAAREDHGDVVADFQELVESLGLDQPGAAVRN